VATSFLFAAGASVTASATFALLVFEKKQSSIGRWLAKPIASLGFVVAAFGAGAPDTSFGRFVLGGLLLSLTGDVLLIPKADVTFLLGLGSFLLGHAAFALGFAQRGIALPGVLLALGPVVLASGLLWRWLGPHLSRSFRAPVLAYTVTIGAMVVLAAGTFARSPSAPLLAGALAFAVSDVSVARERFVAASFSNKLWGLPLYYVAQLLLAVAAGSG
jgi:uncharacterized membrane protein YhhN